MPQPNVVPTPTPPALPQGRDIGRQIEDLVNKTVAGAMQGARAEMQREVTKLEARRDALQERITEASSPTERARLQSQLEETERELAKMRTGLDKLDREFGRRDQPQTFTETRPATSFPPPRNVDPFNPAPMVIAIMGILFIGFPMALTVSRFIWKRSTHAPAPPITLEQQRRFDRLEQSVDAIAIEVERISENQRYLTKLLAEPKKQEVLGTRE